MLAYARSLIGAQHLLVNAFDLVHSSIALYGTCTKTQVKGIYYNQMGYMKGRYEKTKHFQRLTQTQICKGCPQEGPLPVSMFYLCKNYKTNLTFLNTYCIKCNAKKSSAYYKLNKQNERYRIAQYNASMAWYNRMKHNPSFKAKRKANYRERMQDPAFREMKRLSSEKYRIKKTGRLPKGKPTLPAAERRKIYAKRFREKHKDDPVYKEKAKKYTNAWRLKMKDDPVQIEKAKARAQKFHNKNKGNPAYKKRKREYVAAYRAKKKAEKNLPN